MKYDIEYFENMLRMYSHSAETICRTRWQWLTDNIKPLKTVLDYGSGVGWFRAWRPPEVQVYSYDIGPYPQTGIEMQMYDCTCFWDTLEHIPDFGIIEPVLALSKNVALSLPIHNGEVLEEWKHFKPGEHLHYFTYKTLTALFARYGFSLLADGTPECPPRKDIYSFIFKKETGRKNGTKE